MEKYEMSEEEKEQMKILFSDDDNDYNSDDEMDKPVETIKPEEKTKDKNCSNTNTNKTVFIDINNIKILEDKKWSIKKYKHNRTNASLTLHEDTIARTKDEIDTINKISRADELIKELEEITWPRSERLFENGFSELGFRQNGFVNYVKKTKKSIQKPKKQSWGQWMVSGITRIANNFASIA